MSSKITGKMLHTAYEHAMLEEKKKYAEVDIPTPIILPWEGCSPRSRELYEKMAAHLNAALLKEHGNE